MIELTFDLKNYDPNGKCETRTAARGVIQKEGKYLLVLSRKGDYKFPGGGVEPGESLIDAMCREVREETGYPVSKSSCREWAVVRERRKGLIADILEMDSHYFLCGTEGPQGPTDLQGYEVEEEFRTVWLPLEEALATNRRLEASGYTGAPWLVREIKVMERLLEEGDLC